MCSTMRLIFNLYSTFNALFNIQLRIQHSTIHFIFNSLFTHTIIYSTISTIYSTFNFNFKTFNYSFNIQLFVRHSTLIQHSTIHSTLLSPHYFWSVTQIKTWWRRLQCRPRKKKLMKMTQGSTSMLSLTFQSFLTRFFKELTRFPRRKWMRKLHVEQHIVVGCRSNGAFASFTQVYPETAVRILRDRSFIMLTIMLSTRRTDFSVKW